MEGNRRMEKQPRYITVRVSKKQAEVWHSLPYRKTIFVEKFVKNKLKDKKEELKKNTKANNLCSTDFNRKKADSYSKPWGNH
jgi:hypothetical protein